MDTEAGKSAGPPGVLTLRPNQLRAGVPVVCASGSLDSRTAPGLQRVLDAPLAIVVDLSPMSVLNPDAVPTLVDLAYHACEADTGVCLVTADHTSTPRLPPLWRRAAIRNPTQHRGGSAGTELTHGLTWKVYCCGVVCTMRPRCRGLVAMHDRHMVDLRRSRVAESTPVPILVCGF